MNSEQKLTYNRTTMYILCSSVPTQALKCANEIILQLLNFALRRRYISLGEKKSRGNFCAPHFPFKKSLQYGLIFQSHYNMGVSFRLCWRVFLKREFEINHCLIFRFQISIREIYHLMLAKNPNSVWNRILDSTSTAKYLSRTIYWLTSMHMLILLFLLHTECNNFATTSRRWRFHSLQLFFSYFWLLRLPKLLNKG